MNVEYDFRIYMYPPCFIYGQILLQCLSRLQNFAARVMRLKKVFKKFFFLSLLKRDDSILRNLHLMHQVRAVVQIEPPEGES